MSKSESLTISGRDNVFNTSKFRKLLIPAIGIGIVLLIITFAISIATLAKVNQGYTDKPTTENTPSISSTTITTTTTTITTSSTEPQPSPNQTLVESIKIEDVMIHLNQLQQIATTENGNRAVGTPGFNQTLDYIVNQLQLYTNYKVTRSYFPVRDFVLVSNPILVSSINNETKNYTYSTDLSTAEFYHVKYSTSANFTDFVELTAIPNVGCSDEDWKNAQPSPAGRVVLVKRGDCTFIEKSIFASKYNARALLLYNDGTSPDRVQPITVNLAQNNTIPALFLSFAVGQALATAAKEAAANASVQLVIDVKDSSEFPVGNICADTPTGNVTQTIVIGSHTDSVPAGPGINDNGSGSAANLGLALALARLFQTSTYKKYEYRVRFCWWGAEEIGLLGSNDHVQKAKSSTVVGERLIDYLINLNYDMLGSPNYIFGIYDGKTAKNDTPASAIPGSNKITDVFRDWFIRQNLPWDYTDFSGRSDYGPFLAEGIVAGGLFSGGDDMKTQEERDRYDQKLGQGMGGISGIIHDPCYHQACDSIQNINVFAYEKMIRAAAYILEFLGRQDDLKEWLYPSAEAQQLDAEIQKKQPEYNSVNEYFGLPYL